MLKVLREPCKSAETLKKHWFSRFSNFQGACKPARRGNEQLSQSMSYYFILCLSSSPVSLCVSLCVSLRLSVNLLCLCVSSVRRLRRRNRMLSDIFPLNYLTNFTLYHVHELAVWWRGRIIVASQGRI